MYANAAVQSAAKAVLAELAAEIRPESTEASIAAAAQATLEARGYPRTWYHECPALVLLGSRSCLSISGKAYRPADEPVGEFNLITVDLSPCDGALWGDCARSFCVEDGVVTRNPHDGELLAGLRMELRLHEALREVARPATTFDEVCSMAASIMRPNKYENLDFHQNFGHTIVETLDARVWVEPGNRTTLADAGLFTFEPHIHAIGGRWGFKHEDVYYMDASGRLAVL
jgi:Xaa-Pro aminopeptidase